MRVAGGGSGRKEGTHPGQAALPSRATHTHPHSPRRAVYTRQLTPHTQLWDVGGNPADMGESANSTRTVAPMGTDCSFSSIVTGKQTVLKESTLLEHVLHRVSGQANVDLTRR